MADQFPTTASGVGTAATARFDSLDLRVAFAVIADALGLDGADDHVLALDGDGPARRYSFSPAAVAVLAATPEPDTDGWLWLAAAPLIEELVDVVGEDWAAEAGFAVTLALTERAGRTAALAAAAAAGPVRFDVSVEPAELLAAGFPAAAYLELL